MSDDPQDPQDEDELIRRRSALDATLRQHEAQEQARVERARGTSMAGYAAAFRLSTEFIAGIAVGTLIGWMIDQLLGTAPFGMIVFLMLGFVAGVFNVMRLAGLMADPHARLPSRQLAENRKRDDADGH